MTQFQRINRISEGRWNNRRNTSNGHAAAIPQTNGHSSTAHCPRILILTASVGVGHLRAAEAIDLAVRQLAPEAEVHHVDVLKLATAAFRRCYGEMYLDFINTAPQVLGFFYNLMDQPPSGKQDRWDHLRISLEAMSMRPFVNLLQFQPWDLIIHTHFLPGEVSAWLRRRRRIRTPQVMVTTDIETHRLWVTQPCEHYFTATTEAALYLQQYGVPESDVTATGIPIHPCFAAPHDRPACLARQGLVGDRPIILQLAGGYGVGPIEDLFRALLQIAVPTEFIVVTGRNARARECLQQIAVPPQHRVKILGLTQEMDQLLAVADLAVTKPGGLTTSECLAMGTPMVIVNPVPGQEERNSDFLLENGAAIKVNHLATLAHKVTGLLEDPARLRRLTFDARRLGRPQAAFDVARISLDLLKHARQGHESMSGVPSIDGEMNRTSGGLRYANGHSAQTMVAHRSEMV